MHNRAWMNTVAAVIAMLASLQAGILWLERSYPLNLDKLAQTGIQFKTCWATPLCGPSRAMIMTGRYGFRTGWYSKPLESST